MGTKELVKNGENKVVKKDITKIKTKKGGEVNVGDIVKIGRLDGDKWVYFIGQLLEKNKETLKAAIPRSSWSNYSIEIKEFNRIDDKIELQFATDLELKTVLFNVQQEAISDYNRKKREFKEAEDNKEKLAKEVIAIFGKEKLYLFNED